MGKSKYLSVDICFAFKIINMNTVLSKSTDSQTAKNPL